MPSEADTFRTYVVPRLYIIPTQEWQDAFILTCS
jgi:hypothetical protein